MLERSLSRTSLTRGIMVGRQAQMMAMSGSMLVQRKPGAIFPKPWGLSATNFKRMQLEMVTLSGRTVQ